MSDTRDRPRGFEDSYYLGRPGQAGAFHTAMSSRAPLDSLVEIDALAILGGDEDEPEPDADT